MSKKDDGGTAFPQHPGQEDVAGFGGMSLRDYFAGAALQGMMAASDLADPTETSVAMFAYKYADAMLAERDK